MAGAVTLHSFVQSTPTRGGESGWSGGGGGGGGPISIIWSWWDGVCMHADQSSEARRCTVTFQNCPLTLAAGTFHSPELGTGNKWQQRHPRRHMGRDAALLTLLVRRPLDAIASL